ncbi:hypothetical protein TNIN_153771, partial [Trichonephila inaurata madagascariensis]
CSGKLFEYQPWHAGWDDSSFIIATPFM